MYDRRIKERGLSPLAIFAIVIAVLLVFAALATIIIVSFSTRSTVSSIYRHDKEYKSNSGTTCTTRFSDVPSGGPLGGIWVGTAVVDDGFSTQLDAPAGAPLRIGVSAASGGVQPDTAPNAATAGGVFEVGPNDIAFVKADVSAIVTGVDNAPYSLSASPFPSDDPRLAHVAFVIEEATDKQLSWGFYFAHGSIWAFSNCAKDEVGGKSWVHGRRLRSYYPGTKTTLKLVYNRRAGTMEWFVNGVFGAHASDLGFVPPVKKGDVYAEDAGGVFVAADPSVFRIRILGPEERAVAWAGIFGLADIGLAPPPYVPSGGALKYPPPSAGTDTPGPQYYGQAGALSLFRVSAVVCAGNNIELI